MVEKLRKWIPGGRARGRNVKKFLRVLPKFSRIFAPVARTTQFFELFRALLQKKLDKPRAGGYNGAGTTKIVVVLLLWRMYLLKSSSYYYFGATGFPKLKKFTPLLQKRLDKPLPSAQILMRYTIWSHRYSTTGAPAPNLSSDALCPCALSTYELLCAVTLVHDCDLLFNVAIIT